MARIFTIDFEFGGESHAAIVSTWKEETQSDFFKIALHDESLQQLVPGGILCFNSRDAAPQKLDTRRDELVQCLKNAVAHHLNGSFQ